MLILAGASCLLSPVVGIMLSARQIGGERRNVWIALCIGIGFAVISSGLDNRQYGDLTTYSLEIMKYQGMPFWEVFSQKYGNYPGAAIEFWLIAQTGQPILLQVTHAFIEYGIISYILIDYSCRRGAEKRITYIALASAVCLVPVYNSVSAIRSTPALAIGMLALYRDVYCRKKNLATAILYIIPVTIHATGIYFLTVRVISRIFRNHKLLLFLMPIVFFAGIQLFVSSADAISTRVQLGPLSLLLKYMDESNVGWSATVAESTFYQLFRVLHGGFSAACAVFILQKRGMQSITDRDAEDANIVLMLGVICGLCIGLVDPAFMRFSYCTYPFLVLKMIEMTGSADHADKKLVSVSQAKILGVFWAASCVSFTACYMYLLVIGARPVKLIATTLFGGIPRVLGLI